MIESSNHANTQIQNDRPRAKTPERSNAISSLLNKLRRSSPNRCNPTNSITTNAPIDLRLPNAASLTSEPRHTTLVAHQLEYENEALMLLKTGTLITECTRSKYGGRGVSYLFVKSIDPSCKIAKDIVSSVVIKSLGNPILEVLGNRIAGLLGIYSPRSVLIYPENINNSECIPIKPDEQKKVLGIDIQQKLPLVAMEFVNARPYSDTCRTENKFCKDILQHPKIWVQIGQIAALDALIGNRDRFECFGQNNKANIMVSKNQDSPDLIAIDQAIGVHERSHDQEINREKTVNFLNALCSDTTPKEDDNDNPIIKLFFLLKGCQ